MNETREPEQPDGATAVERALENAAKILVNFKGEGERAKLEEWEACYAMLFTQMNGLVQEMRKLQKFKDYVHQRLDEAGIPTHPEGEHSKHGCRIGDRLDIALRSPMREMVNHTKSEEKSMAKFPLRDHCEEKAKRLDMPHFTLIASDNHAIPTIERWLGEAQLTGLPQAKVKETVAIIEAMQQWRDAHPELCKNPD